MLRLVAKKNIYLHDFHLRFKCNLQLFPLDFANKRYFMWKSVKSHTLSGGY